jgi:hypothetical protein
MGSGAQIDGFDQVVVHVGVDAGLQEGVERRSCGTAGNVPGFEIDLGRVAELAGGPDTVAMPAD